MMKVLRNKKGFTIAEMIVAFSIVTITMIAATSSILLSLKIEKAKLSHADCLRSCLNVAEVLSYSDSITEFKEICQSLYNSFEVVKETEDTMNFNITVECVTRYEFVVSYTLFKDEQGRATLSYIFSIDDDVYTKSSYFTKGGSLDGSKK